MIIDCYGGPLDGVALVWRADLPSFGPEIYLRMHRSDQRLAIYVGATRAAHGAHPARPMFRYLGVFTRDQYNTFPGKPVWTAAVERVPDSAYDSRTPPAS